LHSGFDVTEMQVSCYALVIAKIAPEASLAPDAERIDQRNYAASKHWRHKIDGIFKSGNFP